MIQHIAYALAWASFAVAHSWLTTRPDRPGPLGLAGRWERLLYNGVSVLHVGVVFAVGLWLLGGQPGFDRPTGLMVGMTAMQVAGLLVFLTALRSYDGARFMGLDALSRTTAARTAEAPEPLQTGGINAYVRHPLYLAGLLLLWGSAGSPLMLATAVWATMYLVIGAVFEERKLSRLYGAAYDRYRARVPMMLPWKGKAWSGTSETGG